MNNPAHQFAKMVQKELAPENYSLKPHYHNQLNGPWYLIPPQIKIKGKGSPYYHLGKFSFSVEKNRDKQPFLFAGVHVEKGSLESTPTEEDWFWHTFTKRVSNGTFEEDLSKICKCINNKVIIEINAHIGDNENKFSDKLIYHWENGEIILRPSLEINSLEVLRNVPIGSDSMKKIIMPIPDNQWAWVDIFFGTEIPLKENMKIEEEAIDPWLNILPVLKKYATEQ